jgi:hypothetical protein
MALDAMEGEGAMTPDDPQPFGLVVGNAFAGHAARAAGNERKAAQYDNALTDLVNIAIARVAARRSLEAARAMKAVQRDDD